MGNEVKNSNEKFCSECGKPILRNAEICPHCGCRQIENDAPKNRNTAAIFALILGGFGAHKFYLGKTFQGVLYLLFCWTFIPGVLALIEGILYLLMSDAEFKKKYTRP